MYSNISLFASSLVCGGDIASLALGGKNTRKQIETDANDLAGAAKRDADSMVENSKKMDSDNVQKYEKAAEKIKQKDNTAYDDWLNDQLD